MLGADLNKIKLVKYDHSWNSEYLAEKYSISKINFGVPYVISHVGGTSVYLAKSQPVIDILIGIESFLDLITVRGKLMLNGYYYIAKLSSMHQFVLMKMNDKNLLTHTIYLVVYQSKEWNDMLTLKNYLSSSLSNIYTYNDFKTIIAKKYALKPSLYRKEKYIYIRNILKKII